MVSKKWNLVVIGSGGAGLAAAVTAMQGGIGDILVLEKSHFMGGNSRMAGGMLYSPETDKTIPAEKARDKAFREGIEFHHYTRIEPKILRGFIDNAQGTADWLDESGFRGYKNLYPFGNFYKSIKKMATALEEAGNTIFIDTAVTSIITDGEGVKAVAATGADGAELTFETKAVMLATGGFTGNSELLHKYFPDQYDDCFYTDALPLDGSGIELARGAGAALTEYCTIIKENAYSCESSMETPNRGAHQAKSLWVNSYGERFHDESKTMNETTNALVKQKGMVGYALFDQDVLEAIKKSPFMPMGGSDDDDEAPAMPMPAPADDGGHDDAAREYLMRDLGQQLESVAASGTGWVGKADTIEGLADYIGADHEVLKASVEEYNGYCHNGRDELFAKNLKNLVALRRGPFYALKFRPILIDTAGPVVVDEKMRVLDNAHKPIPGLYAGGVITSGWQGVDYHFFGSALCYSITSGRLAGRSIVEQLK